MSKHSHEQSSLRAFGAATPFNCPWSEAFSPGVFLCSELACFVYLAASMVGVRQIFGTAQGQGAANQTNR